MRKELIKTYEPEDYLPINKIIGFYKPINIIITARGVGKTFSFARWALLTSLNDSLSKFAWIRRSYVELKQNVADFRVLAQELGVGNKIIVTNDGVYYAPLREKQGKRHTIQNKLIYFISINNFLNYRGLVISPFRALIFDEAIINAVESEDEEHGVGMNRTLTDREEELAFLDILESLSKASQPQIFFLANP